MNQLKSLRRSKKLLEKNEKMLLRRLTGIISSEDGVKLKELSSQLTVLDVTSLEVKRDIQAL